MKTLCLLFLLAAPPDTGAWKPFEFLLGDWVGEGSGGGGAFSLHPELGGKILVRKNHAEYPATNQRPAILHDDLLVVYRKSPSAPYRATYWDNEGHIIEYTVTGSPDGKSLSFVSDIVSGEPRFRLTYKETAADEVAIDFEIAPPGKPEAFAPYLSGKARRK